MITRYEIPPFTDHATMKRIVVSEMKDGGWVKHDDHIKEIASIKEKLRISEEQNKILAEGYGRLLHENERLKGVIERTEKALLPKNTELWEKLPCPKGSCSTGWSLGVGIHKVDAASGFSWGTIRQIECGCLREVKDA
jgi:hypothetical protein